MGNDQKSDKGPQSGIDSSPGQVQAALQVPDLEFRLMVESIKDYAIFLIDPQGLVRSWNAGAHRMKGYRAEEIIGSHISVFYGKDDVKSGAPQRELDMARAQGTVEVEGWRLRKDGSKFWAAITTTALVDEKGELLGYGKVTRDISERRNTEEALQRSRNMFERLFESAPDAVVVVDRRGVIRKVNQQAEALFGAMREEVVGHRIEYLIPERFHKRHRQERRKYFEEPRVRKMGVGLDLYGRNRDGREFPVDVMLSPIETPDGTWAFAVVRDITQRKRSEALIEELNSALKQQVDQLAVANKELESFSYSVSHDLRAPLRHITGFVKLLFGKDLSSLDQKSLHYLEVISESAQKMGTLIDDLLNFSRMGRTEIMQSRVDLEPLVKAIVHELAEENRDRAIEWSIGPLPTVVGDAVMLRQVLVNLVSNGLKFTRTRSPAKIEIGAITDHPDEYLFYVRDNGVGFDARYGEKLFGLFQRLHSNEEFEGTGVGLAIVQRVLRRHGGRAWAESEEGQGATFWFALPKPPDAAS